VSKFEQKSQENHKEIADLTDKRE